MAAFPLRPRSRGRGVLCGLGASFKTDLPGGSLAFQRLVLFLSRQQARDWDPNRRRSRDIPLVAQKVKRLHAMRETQVRSLGQEDPVEKEMATDSSILAWEIPWLEEPGGLQSMGPQSLTRLSDFFSPWSFGALPKGCASAPRLEGAFREPAALAARAPEAERTRYLLSLEIELAVLGRERERDHFTGNNCGHVPESGDGTRPRGPALFHASLPKGCCPPLITGLSAVYPAVKWPTEQERCKRTHPSSVGLVHPDPSRLSLPLEQGPARMRN